ncbi:MAG: hypothetical protein RIE52_13090 [Balneola sp.]|jgi:hypothetical protein
MIKILIPILLLLFVVNNGLLAQDVNDSSENQDSGKLVISTNLEEFYVVIDHDIKGFQKISSGDTLELKKGIHSITLVWETIRDYEFSIFINPNEVAEKNLTIYQFSNPISNSFQLLENRENVSIATDKNSEIFINGESIGTEQATLFLNPGKYDLFISNPDHGSLNKTLSVGYLEYSSLARYNKNPNPIPIYKKLVPSLGYFARGDSKEGWITLGVLSTTGLLVLQSRYAFESYESRYNQAVASYRNAESPQLALRYRREAESLNNDMEKANRATLRYTLLSSLIYLYTIIDSSIKPKEGYKLISNYKSLSRVNLQLAGNHFRTHLSLNFSFRL